MSSNSLNFSFSNKNLCLSSKVHESIEALLSDEHSSDITSLFEWMKNRNLEQMAACLYMAKMLLLPYKGVLSSQNKTFFELTFSIETDTEEAFVN